MYVKVWKKVEGRQEVTD